MTQTGIKYLICDVAIMGIKTNFFGGNIPSRPADINGVYGSLYIWQVPIWNVDHKVFC